jgi:hypothetical protein
MLKKKSLISEESHPTNTKRNPKRNNSGGIYKKRLNYRKNMAKISVPSQLKDLALGMVFPGKEKKRPAAQFFYYK